MGKRPTEEEKDLLISEMIEFGKANHFYTVKKLSEEFTKAYHETVSDSWTKTKYGMTLREYMLQQGAIMNEEQCREYAKEVYAEVLKMYRGKPKVEIMTLDEGFDVGSLDLHFLQKYWVDTDEPERMTVARKLALDGVLKMPFETEEEKKALIEQVVTLTKEKLAKECASPYPDRSWTHFYHEKYIFSDEVLGNIVLPKCDFFGYYTVEFTEPYVGKRKVDLYKESVLQWIQEIYKVDLRSFYEQREILCTREESRQLFDQFVEAMKSVVLGKKKPKDLEGLQEIVDETRKKASAAQARVRLPKDLEPGVKLALEYGIESVRWLKEYLEDTVPEYGKEEGAAEAYLTQLLIREGVLKGEGKSLVQADTASLEGGENVINWYLSSNNMKESLEVELFDGKVYKYRSRKEVRPDDLVVIGPGYKSSGEMGTVKKILPLTSTKESYTAKAFFGFTEDPTAELIKKNAAGIIEIDSLDTIQKKITSLKPYSFAVTDSVIESVLNAVSVLAYPALATPVMLNKAEEYLASPKTVPAFLFGPKMKDQYMWAEGYPNMVTCPQVIFTGYYPGWKEDLKSLAVWAQMEALGKAARKKFPRIRTTEEWVVDDGESLQIGVLRDKAYVDVLGCQESSFETLLGNDQEFNDFCNELIYRSALSILIRGNLVNLLRAALTAQMPIIPFFDKLIQYAESVGAKECLRALKESNYKNRVFKDIKPTAKKQAEKKTDAVKHVWPKGFVIDDSCTLKGCKSTDSQIQIPEGVKIIDSFAFDRNPNLTEVLIPDSVTQIKKNAFGECRSLERIVFGKNITVIGQECFFNCRGLSSVDLGETKVKTLSKNVFGGCHKLKEIRFPKNLKKIEESALSYTGLSEITIPGTVEVLEMRYFDMFETLQLYFENEDSIEVRLDSSSNSTHIFFHCRKESALWRKLSEANKEIQSRNERYPRYPDPLYNLVENE